jgi:hypothetical protein
MAAFRPTGRPHSALVKFKPVWNLQPEGMLLLYNGKIDGNSINDNIVVMGRFYLTPDFVSRFGLNLARNCRPTRGKSRTTMAWNVESRYFFVRSLRRNGNRLKLLSKEVDQISDFCCFDKIILFYFILIFKASTFRRMPTIYVHVRPY